MKPYALLSDLHCHNWSAFCGAPGPDGMNRRLGMILGEMRRAAGELKAAGGTTMVIAGDLFHQRGSIDPECFNPTFTAIEQIAADGVEIIAIPGNHDLKGTEAHQLGNAMQKLDAVIGVEVVTQPKVFRGVGVVMVPWIQKLDVLKKELQNLADTVEDHDQLDLVIHAGINGVIQGLPDHGLEAPWLASLGFRRVFAGHYHAHKVMEAGAVISIGSTTQQTWGDVGTKAGFLLVHPERIDFRASRAPSFVDIDAATPDEDVPLLVDGNYVRIRGMKLTDLQVKEMRTEFEKLGAKGVSFQVAREVATARTGATATKGLSLDESVTKYIDSLSLPNAAVIQAEAQDVLATVRSVTR
jgi:DNA repair exonuclease SbcCD nuclease subunit